MIDGEPDVNFERVQRGPHERQPDAAGMPALIEQQDSSPFELTDGQLAEARRRRTDTNLARAT
ncbi:MAG: hypothetical protein ACLPX9_13145 [Rhodomicrobium sp.]